MLSPWTTKFSFFKVWSSPWYASVVQFNSIKLQENHCAEITKKVLNIYNEHWKQEEKNIILNKKNSLTWKMYLNVLWNHQSWPHICAYMCHHDWWFAAVLLLEKKSQFEKGCNDKGK